MDVIFNEKAMRNDLSVAEATNTNAKADMEYIVLKENHALQHY